MTAVYWVWRPGVGWSRTDNRIGGELVPVKSAKTRADDVGTTGAAQQEMAKSERLYQLRFSSKTQHALFRDEGERRVVVHCLARVLRGKLVVYGFVDQHGHTFHHGIPVHPALWTGSSFLDVIGARVIEGMQLRLFEALPRLVAEDLLPMVGLTAGAIRPASDRTVRGLGAVRLKRAAAAAFAVDPQLRANDRPTTLARRVVVSLARVAGIATRDIAWVLELTRSGICRVARKDLDARWEEAVRRRLTLEETVRAEIEQDWCRRMIQEHATKR